MSELVDVRDDTDMLLSARRGCGLRAMKLVASGSAKGRPSC